MMIVLNGVLTEVSEETTEELRKNRFPDADTVIVDGAPVDGDTGLEEYSLVYICRLSGTLTDAITKRCTKGVTSVLKGATVGIAGAGGLGSNIATYLARSGIGRIIIADFDRVEPSNLNRQNYNLSHLGLFKVDAIAAVISQINPEVEIIPYAVKIDRDNLENIFRGCDVICEAFDAAEEKTKLIEATSSMLPGIPIVCGNGMAGIEDTGNMGVRRLSDTLYICGDGESEAGEEGIMAPRVAVCAGMMANTVLRILARKV
ncbi:MAG: sulfur carrier protein ThiS adenylyltransferase ThiF [Candidatus Methanomethylophilus sp.]|nr:sulfur carrier protein ThiS adenylyltransferase ThiF [Methanomethylophilus sp.]